MIYTDTQVPLLLYLHTVVLTAIPFVRPWSIYAPLYSPQYVRSLCWQWSLSYVLSISTYICIGSDAHPTTFSYIALYWQRSPCVRPSLPTYLWCVDSDLCSTSFLYQSNYVFDSDPFRTFFFCRHTFVIDSDFLRTYIVCPCNFVSDSDPFLYLCIFVLTAMPTYIPL